MSALGSSLRKSILRQNPDVAESDHLCLTCFEAARAASFAHQLKKNQRELSNLEREVLKKITDREIVAVDPTPPDSPLTTGQRVADRVAAFGGSWTFILTFLGILVVWITFNVVAATLRFDPYPFILLNLVLSCIAALQAPIIMMSQNRQEEKDRERARNDYMVNLKAELEVRALHDKIDHLLRSQMHTLMEFQEAQLEILQRLARQNGKP
ncbi:MAG: DUF1003 domain-containing protein [Fimbriimonadaceae bacterium]|nr:DUF1003 domain-containing protein [Fimbriimonadaceae bacterium]